MRSYRPPLAFFDLDPRDLRVSVSVLVGCVRALIGTMRRHAPTRRSVARALRRPTEGAPSRASGVTGR